MMPSSHHAIRTNRASCFCCAFLLNQLPRAVAELVEVEKRIMGLLREVAE